MSTSGRGGLVPAPWSCCVGAQLSLSHSGAECRDGHPTLPHGSPCALRAGRGPGWPVSIRGCVTDGFGVWCCPRGAPVLTLPAAGSSFPGVCGEPVGARATFPFWQRGRGGSWVSADPGVPRERGWALPWATRVTPGHGSACVSGQSHPVPALTPRGAWAPKPTGPYAVVCSWKVWRGIPTAGAGNGGTASPIRSIPACSLCPGIHHSPQTHPGLCQPQQGILTRPSLGSLSLLTTSLPTALG